MGIYNHSTLNIAQKYIDENEQEDFYCCTWSIDPISGAPLLVMAGFTAVIKIIDTSAGPSKGNGGEIHEMKSHPKDPSLLFSASKDLSIRLWRIDTMQTVAIFAGECGHHEAPLSIDVHLSGDFFASSGMDRTVNIWSLCTPVMKNAINSSISRPSSSSCASSCCSSNDTQLKVYRAVVAVLLCFCGR
ncbi:unnamed protein product [Rhizophagus irregularis]|nr:unnamed protein product [Rhizophagus irregularis]